MAASAGTQSVLFRQLFDGESSTYTYLLADPNNKEVRVDARGRPAARPLAV
jgi:hypothetical protein